MSETDTSPGAAGIPDGAAPETPTESPSSASIQATATQLTRRGHVRKWDRPPPPHDWRWYVGNVGKVLIAVGLLMFSFVGYQLYGTGIETAAAQRGLENEFEEQLAQSEPIEAPPVGSSGSTDDPDPDPDPDPVVAAPVEPSTPPEAVVPVEDQNLPSLENGDALARIEIPRIGVDDIVVAGVETDDLKRGPGHFPDTPLPGQLGNSAIAGHRTTYGQPFRNVDQLAAGDEIRVTTLSGTYVYRVTGQQIVSPSDYQVVATTDPTRANLTLTSCHPVFTARQRIVIFSELAYTESAPVGEPILNYGRPTEPTEGAEADVGPEADTGSSTGTNDDAVDDPTLATPDAETPETDVAPESPGEVTGALADDEPSAIDQLGTDAVNEGIADAFSEGWFSDSGANSQVALWGAVLAAVALAASLISRRFRRDWLGLAIGLLPFVVTLYFFFQNVNRLLPPNL
jgi:sortase A